MIHRGAQLASVVVLGFCLIMGTAFAANITIWDASGHTDGGIHTWETWDPPPTALPWEDNEVEPNCVTGQEWDLEGMFLDTDTDILTMVGGWNFTGETETWSSGDIFIALDLPQYGAGTGAGTHMFADYGYYYVIDVDWGEDTYDVYSAFANGGTETDVETVYYTQNDESNPWGRVEPAEGGTNGTWIAGGTFSQYDSDVTGSGFEGTFHNSVAFDLSWLAEYIDAEDDVWFHFTEECGNDNLMGYSPGGWDPGPASVPEPASVGLLGMGLLGLMATRIRRKRF